MLVASPMDGSGSSQMAYPWRLSTPARRGGRNLQPGVAEEVGMALTLKVWTCAGLGLAGSEI